MTGMFRPATDLEADGWKLDGNIFRKGDAEYLPLYEAKLLHQYDHRWATYDGTESQEVSRMTKFEQQQVSLPRYWVPAQNVNDRLKDRWDRGWLICWRDICRNTDIRTTIAGILPRVGVGHTSPLMMPRGEPIEVVCLYASLCSFVFDYVSRQKIGGTHLTFGLLNQLSVLPPGTYVQPCPWDRSQTLTEWIKPRVLELTYTAHDLKPFAEDLGYTDEPFIWDDDRRAMIRAELDAAFFHLYGISKDDSAYILETFPIVKQKDIDRFGTYRTKEMILDCYDRMTTGEFVSELEIEPGKRVPTDLYGDPIQRPRRERLIQSFSVTRKDEPNIFRSSEYMVCSDLHRKRYFEEAQRTIPRITEEEACKELWNARRTGQLSGLTKSTKYHPPKGLRHYEFVIEWAYRHIINQLVSEGQTRKNTTLERILCTPDWRGRFDDLIGKLMEPTKAYHQFEPKDYRMVAMSIRKSTGGKQATASLFDQPTPIAQAEKQLPEVPGLYLIRSEADSVFTGQTENLRYQYAYMKEVGNGSLVPTWLLNGIPAKTIAFQTFEQPTPEKGLQDYWRANLHKQRPLLNLFEEEAV